MSLLHAPIVYRPDAAGRLRLAETVPTLLGEGTALPGNEPGLERAGYACLDFAIWIALIMAQARLKVSRFVPRGVMRPGMRQGNARRARQDALGRCLSRGMPMRSHRRRIGYPAQSGSTPDRTMGSSPSDRAKRLGILAHGTVCR